MKRIPVITLIISCLASGIGSIITEFSFILGAVLIIIGIVIAIFQIITDNITSSYLTQMIEAQNKLLASSGAGNVYQKMFESELSKKGRSPRAIEHLKNAYSIEPNNLEVIKWLSIILAATLSYSNWAREYPKGIKNNKEWILAKNLAEQGLRMNSKERILMDAQGILFDTVGNTNWLGNGLSSHPS